MNNKSIDFSDEEIILIGKQIDDSTIKSFMEQYLVTEQEARDSIAIMYLCQNNS